MRNLSQRITLSFISGFISLLLLSQLLFTLQQVNAGSISLNGVGGVDIVYNPADGYVYLLNSNDSVSVIDGKKVVATIDLPTGSLGRTTDIDVAANGDVYVSQWFFDQVVVIRDQQIAAIIPRQIDGLPGANGVENGPFQVTTNPVNGLVYVTTNWSGEQSSNGVTIISGTAVLAQVKTGFFPQATAVNARTGLVYVANAISNTVSVIADTTLIKQIPVGTFPTGLAVDSQNSLIFVANQNDNSLSVINENSLTVVATIPTSGRPTAVYAHPNTAEAFVINRESGTVDIIDGISYTRTTTLNVGQNPLAILGDDSSGLVYVANQMDGTINIIAGGQITATVGVGASPLAMALDPIDGLYVINFKDATLSLIKGNSMVATIGGLPQLSHIAMAPLPTGEIAAADLTGRQTWILTSSQVITNMDTIPTPLNLRDTPARIGYFDYLQVAHVSAVADDDGYLYVTNHEEASVSVISPSVGLRENVWVFEQPFDLAYMPGSGVFAAVGRGITQLQGPPPVTAQLLDYPELVGARAMVSWPAANSLYVATSPVGEQAKVAILDTNSLTVTDSIPVCDIPAAIDIDTVQNLIYVSCSGSNSVGVISGTTWLGEVAVGQFPQDILVNPVNGLAYVAAMLGNQVAILDGNTLLAMIPVPTYPIALDVDSAGRVYVASEVGNTVSIISGTQFLTSIPMGDFPNSVLAHDDGNIYVGTAHDAAIDVFRWQSLTVDPGNDWPEATVITPGIVYAAPIEDNGDVDWYKIHLDQPGTRITVTLGGLAADYDLAMFNPLTGTDVATTTIETLDVGQVDMDGRLLSLSNWVDLGQLRSLPFKKGGIFGLSGNSFIEPESLADTIWQPGDYYIAVWGYNGAFSDQPYTLRTNVSLPTTIITPALPITLTAVPPPLNNTVQTLIVTNRSNLTQQYGITRTSAFTTRLNALAQAVSGTIIYLDDFPDIKDAYDQWQGLRQNPLAANITADIIKSLLESLLLNSYPNVKYILLAGDDNIIPFYRIPDNTLISNERNYNAFVSLTPDSPMGARLEGGYLLSDNFYASYHPLQRQGRPLFIPEYAIGRLVETPEEMTAAIDAYLTNGPVVNAQSALVTGYDFVADGSQAISDTLGTTIITLTQLISDNWTAAQLRPLLLTQNHDLISLNGHFNHQLIISGDNQTSIAYDEVVGSAADYQNDLIISIGCQAGLNVPDGDALPNNPDLTHDFAQAFVGRGAAYIANTGYGYGDSDAIGYSELLALQFIRQISNGQSGSIGDALMKAKQIYYADIAFASFGDYDEKVISEWTLFGLPMLQIQPSKSKTLPKDQMPGMPVNVLTKPTMTNAMYTAVPISITNSFTPLTSTRTTGNPPTLSVIGNYFRADSVIDFGGNQENVNGDFQINPGRPLQPRISLDIQSPGVVAHGILFLGGQYTTQENFDPVISRIVSDTALSEPPFPFPRLYPATMQVINRLQLGNKFASERMVIMPAQYLADTGRVGTIRLYNDLRYNVNYAPLGSATDFLPPAIQQVQVITTQQTIQFSVMVTDASGVDRVVVAYDDGQGEWQTFDLTNTGNDTWSGQGPSALTQAFIQAVDEVGNVSLSANKGVYFTAVGISLSSGITKTGQTGDQIVFNHTLTNLGGGQDSFRINLANDAGWLTQVGQPFITLDAGASATVAVTVTVPIGAAAGDRQVVTVTAVSLSNQSISAIAYDTAVALASVYLPVILRE